MKHLTVKAALQYCARPAYPQFLVKSVAFNTPRVEPYSTLVSM